MYYKSNLKFLIIPLIAISLMIAGCAKPPTEELGKAEKAIEEAKQKEVNKYLPEVFSKAEEALKKAKEYVTDKKYKEAKEAAIEAEAIARKAIAEVEAAKEKVKQEAEQKLLDIENAIGELKASIKSIPKGKAFAKVSSDVQAAVEKLEADLAAIKETLQAKRYKEAVDGLNTMKEQVDKQKDEIAELKAPVPAQSKKAK